MNYRDMMNAILSNDTESINKVVSQQIASRKAQYDLYLNWAYKSGIAPVSMNYFVTNYNNIVEANKDKRMNVPLWMSDRRLGLDGPIQKPPTRSFPIERPDFSQPPMGGDSAPTTNVASSVKGYQSPVLSYASGSRKYRPMFGGGVK